MKVVRLRVVFLSLAIAVCSTPAWPWKVNTHQVTVVDAAHELPDVCLPNTNPDPYQNPCLKNLLLGHERYLRAGSMGPDVFYAGGRATWYYGDLAHYCKTGQLAKNMLSEASNGTLEQQAFAYGWVSHVLTDSVGHPWVNVFVGGPYNLATMTPHVALEAWLDRQIFSDHMSHSRATDGDGVFMRGLAVRGIWDGFSPYSEPEIQDLIIESYKKTYSDAPCFLEEKKDRSPAPTREQIKSVAWNLRSIMGGMGYASAAGYAVGSINPLDIPTPQALGAQLILQTWKEYVERVVQYDIKGLVKPKATEDFDLDIGLTLDRWEVGDFLGPVQIDSYREPVTVFPIHVPLGGEKPKAPEDRCKAGQCADNGDKPAAGAGGEHPDDNLSAGSCTDMPSGELGRAYERLAVKKGNRWPSLLAQLRRDAAALDAVADPVAFLDGFVRLGQAYDQAVATDPHARRGAATFWGDTSAYADWADVAVLDGAFASSVDRLAATFAEPTTSVSPASLGKTLLERYPLLVVPTGGLYGLSQAEQFRSGLASYVEAGGTAIVFAQQRGTDFGVLPTPDGRPIKAYGWHEDNSCYTGAAYIETFHPVLASQSKALITSNIDGYFESIPSNAIVLARRVKNGMPSMFMYRYGEGWMIVTSSYDDWGGFNQAGPGARAIIRDTIAWAKKPGDLPLHAPGASATVAIELRNVGATAASQARLVLMSPSRDKVVAEQTVAIAVPAGGTASTSLTHTFATSAELGIYHVDFELLDGSGAVVQPLAETDSGRVVVASPPAPGQYRPADMSLSIVMPGGEDVYAGDPATFRYTLVNRADLQRTFRLWRDIGHRNTQFVDEITLGPQDSRTADIAIEAGFYAAPRFWIHAYEVGGTARPVLTSVRVPGETAAYQTSDGKGFRVHWPAVDLAVAADPIVATPGGVVAFTVTARNRVALPWSGVMRVTGGADGLREEPFTLSDGGTATLAVSARVPETGPAYSPGSTWTQFDFSAVRGDRSSGSAQTVVRAVRPELRSIERSAPVWRRGQGQTVSWTIENVAVLPVEAGTVRAALRDASGATLWQESRPLVLAASPNGRTTVTFDVPALPLDWPSGALEYTAETGLGRQISTSWDIVGLLHAAVTPGASTYGAGEAGEVLVSVTNRGTIFEEGQALGSIEGIGELTGVPFSLAPGQSAVMHLPFQVPAAVVSGLHGGALQFPYGPSQAFTVSIRPPKLELSADRADFTVGDEVGVRVRNAGGSRAVVAVTLSVAGGSGSIVKSARDLTLEAGEETRVTLPPLPLHLPTGSYGLIGRAADSRNGVSADINTVLTVAGTSATLAVSTDHQIYAPAAAMQVSARVVNGAHELQNALLHLEIRTSCSASGGSPESSYHIDTWDGTQWVEQAVRHRGSRYETDVVDLAAYLPDADGEYKVRIRQRDLDPALLDYVALLSRGAPIAPTTALVNDFDIVSSVQSADDMGARVGGSDIVLVFPPAPQPSLVFRALEGSGSCEVRTLWQKDVALDLAPAAEHELTEALAAPGETGEYILAGAVLTRAGAVLAGHETVFQVASGPAAVSLTTDRSHYRLGDDVAVSGVVENLASADDFTVTVYRKDSPWDWSELYSAPLSLAAGEKQAYSFSTAASAADVNLLAVVRRTTGWGEEVGRGEWSFTAGTPELSVDFDVPSEAVRFVPTSPRLVAVEESDLTAVSKQEDGELAGDLPFPVVLRGIPYNRFRQSVKGFVELVPEQAYGPTSGFAATCLSDLTAEAAWQQGIWWAGESVILAPSLGDLDPSASGLVGYRLYQAGERDRAGRAFDEDTLVFVWDAPQRGQTERNRFQLLIAKDGLIRMDAERVAGEASCARTGFKILSKEALAFTQPAPFGVRLETGVGRAPFKGAIVVTNHGTYPGKVTLDYGRAEGSRTTAELTLEPKETRRIEIEDAVTAETTYSLNVSGDYNDTITRTVAPAQRLSAAYTGSEAVIPGPALLPVALLLKGGVAGATSVTYTLRAPSGTQTVTRDYDLEPGIRFDDAIPFALVEGALVLEASAEVPVEFAPVTLQVAPLERVAVTVDAGAIADGRLPIIVDVANSGLAAFAGTVQVDGVGGSTTPVALAPGETRRLDLMADLGGASPGVRTFVVRLVSDAGVVLSETSIERDLRAPQVVLAESPAGQSFDAGSAADLRFVLRNTGDQPASGVFRYSVFDEERAASYTIEPGGQSEIVFTTYLEDDVEQKVFPGRYVIATQGSPESTGQVSFTVNGIALAVEAALDKDAYADGDTAHLTVNVTNGRQGLGTEYLVRTHYGSFEETKPLTVSDTTTVVFDIPVTQVTGEAVFLGISHPDGRSLYINTYHLRKADASALVTLDQQVYAPGASVSVSVATASAGTLSLSAPGYSETITAGGGLARTFILPADLPGGTYFVSWSLTPTTGDAASGQVPFDVSGLRVRVFAADLDKGRYESGETIGSRLLINTNQSTTATLRGFIVDPDGGSALVGETTVTLTPEMDLVAAQTWPFSSNLAGLHRLVYGLYQPQSDTLLASGDLYFDVGSAAVLAVHTDKDDYSLADEPVSTRVTVFVSAASTLRLELDGGAVATRELSATGIVDVTVEIPRPLPGDHRLAATVQAGGYTSRRETAFRYGSSLPDLISGVPIAQRTAGAGFRIVAPVSNVGRTAAPATILVISDVSTGTPLGSAAVPALGPAASALASVDWNGAGAAGPHEIEAVADATTSVVEFRESNNTMRGWLEVPPAVVDVTTGASYAAGAEAVASIRLINLTSSTTFAGATAAVGVLRPDGSQASAGAVALGQVGPGATVTATKAWAIGTSAPGNYEFSAVVTDASGQMLGDIAFARFEVLRTVSATGSVEAAPNPVRPGESVTFKGQISNTGNVAISGAARFDVVSLDGSVVDRRSTSVQVPLQGTADVASSPADLNLGPGEYRLTLRLEADDKDLQVASTTLVVGGERLRVSLVSDTSARVLAFVGGPSSDTAGRRQREGFVKASLAGKLMLVTSDPLEFAQGFRSGRWNTYVVMTDAPCLLPLLADEIREAVFRGNGFVLVQWRAGASANLEPALGGRVTGQLPGQTHMVTLTSGPLGPAQTLSLPGSAARLGLDGATVLGTLDGGLPAITMNTYGHGGSALMAFDPAVPLGHKARAALEGLFGRLVTLVTPSVAPDDAPVVPLAVRLENPSGAAQEAEVAVDLTAGLALAVVDDSPTQPDQAIWRISVPAGQTRLLRFAVALPDQVGTYSVSATVRVDGSPVGDPATLALVVTGTADDAVADAITTLEALSPEPRDRGHVQSALSLLNAAQRADFGLVGLELKIRLSAEASEKLGDATAVDTGPVRLTIGRAIACWERLSSDWARARLARESAPKGWRAVGGVRSAALAPSSPLPY